jgi:hypothetical protein
MTITNGFGSPPAVAAILAFAALVGQEAERRSHRQANVQELTIREQWLASRLSAKHEFGYPQGRPGKAGQHRCEAVLINSVMRRPRLP